MAAGFKCNNCGKCCMAFYSQINLTLGDILRVSKFLGRPVSDLMGNEIGINAFGSPEKPEVFSYEFGINMPCSFRKNKRCLIYPARPLNCRLFPYWVFVKSYDLGDSRMLDRSYPCMENLELSKGEIKAYREYCSVLGEVVMQESSLTDSLLFRIGVREKADLSGNERYAELCREFRKKGNGQDALKELECSKIRLCKELFRGLREEDIRIIEDELKKPFLAGIIDENRKRTDEAEKILRASREQQ